MPDQTRALIAIAVFATTILLVGVVVAARFRPNSNDSLIVKLGLSSCFLLVAALAWSLCYIGFVSGVMVSINRWRTIENDVVSNSVGYWVALGFAYLVGVVFLSIGAVILLARRTGK